MTDFEQRRAAFGAKLAALRARSGMNGRDYAHAVCDQLWPVPVEGEQARALLAAHADRWATNRREISG